MLKTTLLALSVCIAASPAFADDYVIRNNKGGDLQQFINNANKLNKQGKRVVIDGTCSSSCILYTLPNFKLNTCATERAKLGFHRMEAYRGNLHGGKTDRRRGVQEFTDSVTKGIIARMPPRLAAHFAFDRLPDPRKGKTGMVWVNGKDAQRAIGACE